MAKSTYPYVLDIYGRPLYVSESWRVGATIPTTEQIKENEAKVEEQNISNALRSITPTLIIVGIVTGASFAIGSGLVSRYLFKK